jgi:WhiB family redox-sensing transcriptional regulator
VSPRDESYWRQRAASLDWLRDVPDDVLIEMVLRDCQCAWIFDPGEAPQLPGVDEPDRELAAQLCAGCPAMDECLELDLRIFGPRTTGVFGAMPEQDRRALYPYWVARRQAGGGGRR